jgi:hypothetical protein
MFIGGGIGAVVITIIALLLGINPGDLMQEGSARLRRKRRMARRTKARSS